ncbi:MAG: hypothetical protein V1824_04575 [archaeon]
MAIEENKSISKKFIIILVAVITIILAILAIFVGQKNDSTEKPFVNSFEYNATNSNQVATANEINNIFSDENEINSNPEDLEIIDVGN